MSSAAYVDALPFTGGGTYDICKAINTVLTNYGSATTNGVVVDARGINPGTPQSCGSNPWNLSTVPPNVVLLPPGTITTTSSWVLPQYTTVMGAGKNSTTVKGSGLTSGAVIQMGGGPGCPTSTAFCFGVVVSDLTIDTNNSVDGIDNLNAEELSYVKRVAIINVTTVGLKLTNSAGGTSSHSGPYEDISISLAGSSAACVDILGAAPRGIHGLTCNAGSAAPAVGIYLDGYNVSLQDAYITGAFTNGIYIGSQSSSTNLVYGNVLFNVQSSGATNAVHLYYAGSGMSYVSDLTMMGVTSSSGTATIKDDLPGGTSVTDASVGLYVVGEPVSDSSGYIAESRFNTATSGSSSPFPAWIVGTSTPSAACSTGSLYSRIANSSGNTLWGCAGGGWRLIY
jgi:hypothetical protein